MALTDPWTGPFGGVPPVDQIEIEAFEPSLEAAMVEHRAELEAIASQPDDPTFQNTVVALEHAGSTLSRVRAIYEVWCSNHSSPELRVIQRRMAPRLAAHKDRYRQDSRLIGRLKPLLADTSTFDEEQERLLHYHQRAFVRAGANLDPAGKQDLERINAAMSTLFTQFDENLLADEEKVIVFLDKAELGGLPQGWLAGATTAAADRGQPGSWAVLNTRSSAQPFLEFSSERSLRERVWRVFTSRADNGDDHDNNAIVQDILELRTARAQLLGYPTSAHMLLADSMAETPTQAQQLLDKVWGPAVAKYAEETAAMVAWAKRNGQPSDLQPWDVRFCMEKVRAETHNLDTERLQQHLSVDRLRDGLFWMAEQCLGWKLEAAPEIPTPHPDVTAWLVSDSAGPKGIWMFDPFARVGKRSGAWMTAWRVQQAGVLPIVSNNENYVAAPKGQPTRLSWDDAQTLFHEFGHAMHGLASKVRYPSLAGTNVSRDFVEFPSQLAEHWLNTPELLARFALDDEGNPLPESWIASLKNAANSSSGFSTLEFLSSAVVDLALHQQTERVDLADFEKSTLQRFGLPKTMVMRHRLPHFSHLFSSDGYAAAYYSYLWADVLVADAAEAFAERGFYNRSLYSHYHDTVLSRGDTVDPAEAFRAFLKRDPSVEALLRDRGLHDVEEVPQRVERP